MSSVSTLLFISQQVVIYIGIFLLAVGCFGQPFVLTIFLSLKTFRESSCAFYLTIMSIMNTLLLFTGLFTFVMINGFNINWTAISLFYCKFRMFYVQICILISFTSMCLAIIDQYLATCSNPRLHRFNQIKYARRIILIAACIWICHGIPALLFNNHIISSEHNQTICALTNVIFQKYYTAVYLTTLSGGLPIIIMIIFSFLSYRNIRQLAHRTIPMVRRELDKQITNMVLVQGCFGIIAVTPQIIYSFYSLAIGTPTDPTTSIILPSLWNLITTIYYFHFISSFPIYFLVSKRFRQQFFYVFHKISHTLT